MKMKHLLVVVATVMLAVVLIGGNAEAKKRKLPKGTPAVFAGLQAEIYGSQKIGGKVAVYLAGDSGSSEWMIPNAHGDVQDNPAMTAIVLARPGCTVRRGGPKSIGSHIIKIGETWVGDHYTPENIDMVIAALWEIKSRYNPVDLSAVGQSGGAATAGIILGMQPSIFDAAVLIATPTDVPAWRRFLMRRDKGKKWSEYVWRNSLSPIDFIQNIRPDVRVSVIVGEDDNNTKPFLSEDYVEKAHELGLYNIQLTIVPDCGHEGNFKYNDHAALLSG